MRTEGTLAERRRAEKSSGKLPGFNLIVEDCAGAWIVVGGGMPGALERVLVDDQPLETNRAASVGLSLIHI